MRAHAEEQLRTERLIAEVTSRARPPRSEELAESYRRNKDRFRTKEMVRAVHIVKQVEKGGSEQSVRESAEELYRQIRSGTSFEEVADNKSDCPGGGGDLGFFGRGEMVKEFEDVVFNLPVGEMSGVFKTMFGIHIAKVLDRRPAGVRPFSAVKPELEKEAMDQRRTQLLEQFVDRLRDEATIEGPQLGATAGGSAWS